MKGALTQLWGSATGAVWERDPRGQQEPIFFGLVAVHEWSEPTDLYRACTVWSNHSLSREEGTRPLKSFKDAGETGL
jgi:hypothetical protein